MASHDAPHHIDQELSGNHTQDSMLMREYHGFTDAVGGRNARKDTDVRGGRERGMCGPHMGSKAGQGKRHKNFKQLFQEAVRGECDTLDTDGRKHPEKSVEDLVKACCSLPAHGTAVSAVENSMAYLDSRATAALMKELAKKHQLSRAVEIFDWLMSKPADHELYNLCDVYTFTTVISLMGPSKQLARALEYLREMRKRRIHCNVHTYSALMNVCIKCDNCHLALDVLKQMHEDQIRPNVVTYNTLVDVYGKKGQWEKAVQVLDDMRLEGLEPEVRTFNTAIIACNMCGQPQEALKVYDKLLEAGLQPISTTYTALISAYGKAGQLDKALDIFQTMLRRDCERSVITYSALISACEKAGQWELALQLFDQMQKEGCTPNTVTYNSLITACQQGGQHDKACAIFEQMKSQSCRPDAVTYTALINAYNKEGQWDKALQAFEQMQQQNCKLDWSIYQTIIDSLWQTGISWAQNRAWQLYASAARTWQYRFTVQLSNNLNCRDVEYVVPACSIGVAVLALRKWATDLVAQVESDSTLLGMSRDSMLLSLGRSRHGKEPNCNSVSQALLSVLAGFKSPFRPGDVGAITAAGNILIGEAPVSAVVEWLCSPVLPEFLALLAPHNTANSRQPSPLGDMQKRISFAADLVEDANLSENCIRAYDTVLEFERAQKLQPANMSCEYLADRASCIAAAWKMAERFDLSEEVVFDAVLLMDRVMSTGAQHESNLSMLFVAASLRIAALQMVPASDQGAAEKLPDDSLLAAAIGFPQGSVTKMEQNIITALSGDTKSISSMRSLKLMLERMGAERQDTPAAQHLCKATIRLLHLAIKEPVLLSSRPSVVAVAVLVAARQALGCHPFLPACLQQLTGMRTGAESSPELAVAISAIEPLIPAARLDPPVRAAPVMAANKRAAARFGQFAQCMAPSGSGYSSPSHVGTPTATAAGNVPLPGNRSLLDAVVRQHSLQRVGSDMSTLSNHSDGSIANLQALLSSTAVAAAAAAAATGGGSIAGSPIAPRLGSPAVPQYNPALTAAMAGLQLGMPVSGMTPVYAPALAGYNPWLAAGACGSTPDMLHIANLQQQQQQQASQLAQITNPYTMPLAQPATIFNNAAHLLR